MYFIHILYDGRSTERHWCTSNSMVFSIYVCLHKILGNRLFPFPNSEGYPALIYGRFRRGARQDLDDDLRVLSLRNGVPRATRHPRSVTIPRQTIVAAYTPLECDLAQRYSLKPDSWRSSKCQLLVFQT